MKVDDTFYAPYNEGKTYGQTAMNSSPDRVIWYLEGEEKHIPTFKNGYQIVYKNKSELPDQFSLEGFEYVCDSVGIKDIRLDDKEDIPYMQPHSKREAMRKPHCRI